MGMPTRRRRRWLAELYPMGKDSQTGGTVPGSDRQGRRSFGYGWEGAAVGSAPAGPANSARAVVPANESSQAGELVQDLRRPGHLIERNPLVSGVRLGNVAGTKNHGGNTGLCDGRGVGAVGDGANHMRTLHCV